ncbi:acetolactate synthase AlsS [Spiroplasma endosymbiont of Aspidapion aeneum]|uniref:acetolactate synthase AlsS n=1 Tax=Spiroplasma endosymbiont of Aspidapion aeneum TaxID=3066276 RepID=UPI00313ABE89
MKKVKNGANIIVETLINHKIDYVFTVPGAKIDKTLDIFRDYKNAPQLIVTRHEQNAAFMAQGIGRLTNKPGVVFVTSGPGVSNLATGLITATSEGDAILAIGGNVKRESAPKRTHQSMDNVALMKPVTKYAQEVNSAKSISEVLVNAYRIASLPRQGATFVSVPQDVQYELVENEALSPKEEYITEHARTDYLLELAEEIKKAKLPVLLLGMRSSDNEAVRSIRNFLKKVKIPVVETFQGAGIIPRNLEETFLGRVGLFKNQPGDMLLDEADLVIAVGYDPIEYDPETWNKDSFKKIYHIDHVIAEIDNHYLPIKELTGNISRSMDFLGDNLVSLDFKLSEQANTIITYLKSKFENITKLFKVDKNKVHPLFLMQTIRNLIDDDKFLPINDNTIVTVDVGSLYIWMARNFKSYEPRKLLFSNGMQTLGVALPWAISASLLNKGKKVISMSGDGGFLYSSQEIDTAIRLGLNITHLIWNDESYNMVSFQQISKYKRSTAIELGKINFKMYAESFGAKGFSVTKPSELKKVLEEAFTYNGVAIVDIKIDYSENIILGDMLLGDFL